MRRPCSDCGDAERAGLLVKFKEMQLGNGTWQFSKILRYCVDCAERCGILSVDEAIALRKKAARIARMVKESK